MTALIHRLAVRLRPPMHCGSAMDFDVFRGVYVCHCGATR